jgi:hypothetical protein
MKESKTTPGAALLSTTGMVPATVKSSGLSVTSEKKHPRQTSTIQAIIDIGFGNTAFVRGEGPGLSWERGQPMTCVKANLWTFSIESTTKPIVFKILINDEIWCLDDDYTVETGKKVTLAPNF